LAALTVGAGAGMNSPYLSRDHHDPKDFASAEEFTAAVMKRFDE
jgi:hypothetical protein